MDLSILTDTLILNVYGFSGIASTGDYTETAFQLSDKVWKVLKSTGLKNKGKNIWVYDKNKEIFAGVEIEDTPDNSLTIEHKTVVLTKYAYFKHVGSYQLLPIVEKSITAEFISKGFEKDLPYIEIYGHWTNEETKLRNRTFVQFKIKPLIIFEV